jgi:hypothetical protein
MPGVSLRTREKIKKKARRRLDRVKPSRNQGNSAGVRKRLKKEAGKARAAKAKAAGAQGATPSPSPLPR